MLQRCSLGLVLGVFFLTLGLFNPTTSLAHQPGQTPWWSFQSIDTMKLSRDRSREWLNDQTAATKIDAHVAQIAETGATHVAIATPYDEEFLPILKLWVAAARRHHLHVWFRGNWSGWEGWFDYPRITRDQHLTMTKNFILKHPNLFEDGDIFSGCPECENGGPGDPRMTQDKTGHTQFLLKEHQLTEDAFDQINKKVDSNYLSMNGDVARLIMTELPTQALGGIVTVDHYVKSPTQLATDIRGFAQSSGGQVVLGEMGVPIPDIHGSMSPQAQAQWLDQALSALAVTPELIGLNYWTGIGGSTQLWSEDGVATPAVDVLKKYFKPATITGVVQNSVKQPIVAEIRSPHKQIKTAKNGTFVLPYISSDLTFEVKAEGYHSQTVQISSGSSETAPLVITLEPVNLSFGQWLLFKLHQALSIFRR